MYEQPCKATSDLLYFRFLVTYSTFGFQLDSRWFPKTVILRQCLRYASFGYLFMHIPLCINHVDSTISHTILNLVYKEDFVSKRK